MQTPCLLTSLTSPQSFIWFTSTRTAQVGHLTTVYIHHSFTIFRPALKFTRFIRVFFTVDSCLTSARPFLCYLVFIFSSFSLLLSVVVHWFCVVVRASCGPTRLLSSYRTYNIGNCVVSYLIAVYCTWQTNNFAIMTVRTLYAKLVCAIDCQEAVLFHGIFSVHLQRPHRCLFHLQTRLVLSAHRNAAHRENGLRCADARIWISWFR